MLEGSFKHLVLVAPPHMLGELRKYDDVLRREDLKLDEVERDLGGLSDPQLHDHLAHAGILGAHANASRPRAEFKFGAHGEARTHARGLTEDREKTAG